MTRNSFRGAVGTLPMHIAASSRQSLRLAFGEPLSLYTREALLCSYHLTPYIPTKKGRCNPHCSSLFFSYFSSSVLACS